MNWSRNFDDPVSTPAGKALRSLRDAATFIRKLPKKDQAEAHWQLAVEMLIMAAEDRGPVLHAQIAMNRALNYGRVDTEKKPRQRRSKSYRIIR